MTWTRPHRCDSAACVLVDIRDDSVAVGDSKHPFDGHIEYDYAAWRILLDDIRANDWTDDAWITDDDTIAWIGGPGVTLYFTQAEIDTFVAAAKAGEYDLPEETR